MSGSRFRSTSSVRHSLRTSKYSFLNGKEIDSCALVAGKALERLDLVPLQMLETVESSSLWAQASPGPYGR